MSFHLCGLGLAVPETVLTQTEAMQCALRLGLGPAMTAERTQLLYSHAGVNTRHTAHSRAFIDDLLHDSRDSASPFLPGVPDGPTTGERMRAYRDAASPLALAAAKQALLQSRIPAQSVTHLILVTCTGFAAPGVDRVLIEKLGLPLTVERIHVGFMGCHGAINGLRTATAITTADPAAVVLMVAVELCTLHHCYRPNMEQTIANALFADGAAAVVGTGKLNASAGWEVVGTASIQIPGTTDDMSWNIGDHGFIMTLSRNVATQILNHVRPWISGFLARHGLTIADVQNWAIHPGGPRILDAVTTALELPPNALDASRAVLARYGNMSSATVLFVWDVLQQKRPDSPCVMLAFGPGLTAEAALLSPSV